MKDSTWFKLLYYWSYIRTPIGSGLSIPFLIGVEREFSDHPIPFSIKNLIDVFSNSGETGYEISIRQCNTIGTLVCCLEELEEEEKMYTENIGNLFLYADVLKGFSTINSLSDYLSSRFDDSIDRSEYSINAGKWVGFSHDDINTIQIALQC